MAREVHQKAGRADHDLDFDTVALAFVTVPHSMVQCRSMDSLHRRVDSAQAVREVVKLLVVDGQFVHENPPFELLEKHWSPAAR